MTMERNEFEITLEALCLIQIFIANKSKLSQIKGWGDKKPKQKGFQR